jgi:hypothetical protein
MLVSFCLAIGQSSAATGIVLQPKVQSPAPVIDGSETGDTAWASANYTTLSNLVINGTNNNNLKILSLIDGDYIYFGLLLETTIRNESIALALSDYSPSALSSLLHTATPNFYDFNSCKCVRGDGASWDLTINHPNQFNNFTSRTNDITFAAGIVYPENWTFYELDFSLASGRPGDINWTASGDYAMKIFYGTAYGGASNSYYPLISNWTGTGVITMIINPNSNINGGGTIKAGQFNIIVAESIFFVMAIIMFGGIGVYIMNSKKRMRRA